MCKVENTDIFRKWASYQPHGDEKGANGNHTTGSSLLDQRTNEQSLGGKQHTHTYS